jgi:transcriptional regulator with XRE-family HTH domain
MTETGPEPDARRREFGAFLRSRRARLTPTVVGLPNGFRRRTPGLRREEVALLAGVGATWYAWLEQGRDVRASAEALSALADALRLNEAERRHLFLLSGRPEPPGRSSGPECVSESLRRMLASLIHQPAYVTGRRWDVLAWNAAAGAVFGDYGRLEGDERNIMHMVFADPAHRRLLVDWEILAPAVLAMFRADCAHYAGDPDFERLVARLRAESAEFRDWWPKREVIRPPSGRKRIDHPAAGQMEFEYMSFSVIDAAEMRLVVYAPLETADTATKLAALLREPGGNSSAERS